MSGRDYLHIWYQAQLVGALIFLIAIAWWNVLVNDRGIRMLVFILALAALEGLLITLVKHIPRWLLYFDTTIQSILQPIMLTMLWGTVTREIIIRLQLPSRGVVAITLVYYLVMFAPFASEVGGRIHNVIARVAFLIYLFFTSITLMSYYLPSKFVDPQLFKDLIGTGVWGAVAFFIAVTVLMRTWHLSWPGLMPSFGTNWNWWVFSVLIVIYLLYLGLSATDVNWAKIGAGQNRIWLFTALEAGIAEETLFRFGILGIVLYAGRRLDQRVPVAVVTSSVLFGLMHLDNLMDQHWDMTLLQVVIAVAIGAYFAVVYLYTGQLWLTMLMHFLIDLFSFMATQTTAMTGTTTSSDWLSALLLMLYFGGTALWMMFGARRTVMERHADRFTGDHQHFDFSFNFQ